MAWANRHRIFRLPRRADQQPGAERVSIPRPRSLASAVMSAQPKSTSAVAANDETGRRIPPPATSPASLAKCTLRRQTPEVGAECPNWARSDLCGGRSVMGVPTAHTKPKLLKFLPFLCADYMCRMGYGLWPHANLD